MSGRIILAIVLKDLREFPRNPYWVLIGPVALFLLVLSYWMVPEKSPFETIEVGIHPPALAKAARSALGLAASSGPEGGFAKGLKVVSFESEARLRAVVSREIRDKETSRIAIGVAFPGDFVSAVRTGNRTTVRVYLDGSEGMGDVVTCAIREVAYGLRAAAAGRLPAQEFPVVLPEVRTMTLGEVRRPDQVSEERRRTVLTAYCLIVALVVLAGLIAVEVAQRTATAILVTPAKAGDVVVAKCLTGTLLGAVQALIFLVGTWTGVTNWPVAVVVVLLGAAMLSAKGMIAGAAGRGFAMTLFICILLTLPVTAPILSVIRPGAVPLGMKVLPFYGVAEGLMGAIEYGRGWGEMAPYLAMTLAWDVVLLGLGLVVLKRRIETL